MILFSPTLVISGVSSSPHLLGAPLLPQAPVHTVPRIPSGCTRHLVQPAHCHPFRCASLSHPFLLCWAFPATLLLMPFVQPWAFPITLLEALLLQCQETLLEKPTAVNVGRAGLSGYFPSALPEVPLHFVPLFLLSCPPEVSRNTHHLLF